jgi:gamma-glutamylcysteine synthetase
VSVYTSISRSDGNKQAALYLNHIKNKYQKIYVLISGWFPIYYLYFSNNYSPKLLGKIQKGMRTKKINNLYFYNQDCWDEKLIKNFYQKKAILVFSSACEKLNNPRFKMIKQINNISNLPIYYIFEFR